MKIIQNLFKLEFDNCNYIPQQDCQEFITKFLDKFTLEYNDSNKLEFDNSDNPLVIWNKSILKRKSFFDSLFTGLYQTHIECSNNHISDTYSLFNDITDNYINSNNISTIED